MKFKHNLEISLAYPSGMLFLTILGEVMFQFIKINRKSAFILFIFTHAAETRFLRLVDLCESGSIRLSND